MASDSFGSLRTRNLENLRLLTWLGQHLQDAGGKCVSIISLNCRSLHNKVASLRDMIVTHDVDILALTETWLGTSTDAQALHELLPAGYGICHAPRKNRRGGGVAVIYKDSVSVKNLSRKWENINTAQFEFLCCQINISNRQFNLHVIYRPPPSTKNQLSVAKFFDEWSLYLDQMLLDPNEVMMMGRPP